MQSPENNTVVCGIHCLACQDELFVNNPIDVIENDEHDPDFALHLSYFFSSREFEHFHWKIVVLSQGHNPKSRSRQPVITLDKKVASSEAI
jgi:hypothetical protein